MWINVAIFDILSVLHNSEDYNQIFLSDNDQQVVIMHCALGGKVCYLQLP